ncbi:MAG: RNA 2',3'-cyclic phosphodiesterase [Proteobacteria bacterium]|nr:RNA 2',3'-cyclic phosphodiesterase [Pseudomonadota bacterium]MBU1715318.1 RNA 2',3'-cyclic phosphodiesterase [Pseudomonadota bacterium]
MYRLFTAIDLPDQIKSELMAICCGLPDTKWVPADQLHLTLRFIGEVDGVMLNEIKGALAEVKSHPCAMRLKGIGHFPPRKQPKVLWAGVEDHKPLVQLRNRIESILVRCGLEPEHRKFSPHITIARLRDTPISKVARLKIPAASHGESPYGRILSSDSLTNPAASCGECVSLCMFMAAHSLFNTSEFTVQEFHLYSSYLTPKGAIHHQEASYLLLNP